MKLNDPHIEALFELINSVDGYDKMLLDKMEILELEPIFKCRFRPDTSKFVNVYDSIHGGVFSGIVDLLGGVVISLNNYEEQAKHLQNSGKLIREVSTDINISYVSSAKKGEDLYCEAKLLKKGKNIAFTQVDIYKDEGKTLVATGRHTKFIFKSKL
eukprot:NODE_5_length_72347_cov_1.339331.p49 type:complete len:157 gc:universal NODE_5_length_72347_cov_1.339331:53041-52571(-)